MWGTGRLIAVFAALIGSSTVLFAQDVDWKAYGGASVEAPSVCFFDSRGVSKSNDQIRVWTKCLFRKDLDDPLDEKTDRGRKLIEQSARQFVDGYVPPIVQIGVLGFDQRVDVILAEQIANLGDIQPNARIFLELNCANQMERRLSTYVKVNGKEGFNEKPSAWEHVAPETNAAHLQKLLCSSR
jgi:hypothetical protein